MSWPIVLQAGALVLAIVFFSLWRLDRHRGGWWALAWPSLYASGLFFRLSENSDWARPLYPLFGTAFAAFLYAGSRAFANLPRSHGWIAVAIAAGVVRIALVELGSVAATQVGAVLVTSAAALGSAAHIGPPAFRRCGGISERMLAVSLGVLPAASAYFELSRARGESSAEALFIWLIAGAITAALQLAALFEQAARKVFEDRATLEALVDSVPIGLALVDSHGRVTRQNSEFAALSSLSGGEPAGSLATSDAASELGTEVSVHGNGRAISLQRPVRGAHGEEIGRLWMLRDVTVERRLEEELRRARHLETIGRLAGGVAHDFNNQLTVVLGNTALLEDEFPRGDARAEQLADIARAAEHCAAITRDLLDFARQSPSQRAAIDLGALARETVERLERGKAAGVTLRLSLDAEAPRAHADLTQLRRVLDNMLANALTAVGTRGVIEVAVVASPHIAGQVEMSVADDGPGMSEAVRERVFDPFFTTRRDTGGSGLGLAIVHGIVSAHGGTVHVETSPSGGARFVTSWPAAHGDAPLELRVGAFPAPSRGHAVLLVEDEAGVRRLLATALRGASNRVIEFGDAESALQALVVGLERIDIAVVDLSLPGQNGDSLIAELRKRRPGLPVLLMSGHVAHPAALDVPFLAKPFRASELLMVVNSLVRESRA